MKYVLLLILVAVAGGCAMFTSWKSIPPPGGCDQCHTVEKQKQLDIIKTASMIINQF